MKRIFQLKISLLGIEPGIWRRVLVPDSLTLRELHAVIQGAMGWQDCHLHMFDIGGRQFEIPEDDGRGPAPDYEDERAHRLGALVRVRSRFLYNYDFGDDWDHSVKVEKAAPPDPGRLDSAGRFAPQCTGGARACPPEDCGGPYAYPELLEALADPGNPAYRELAEWADGFEPEFFDLRETNAWIAALCRFYRERGWGFAEG